MPAYEIRGADVPAVLVPPRPDAESADALRTNADDVVAASGTGKEGSDAAGEGARAEPGGGGGVGYKGEVFMRGAVAEAEAEIVLFPRREVEDFLEVGGDIGRGGRAPVEIVDSDVEVAEEGVVLFGRCLSIHWEIKSTVSLTVAS